MLYPDPDARDLEDVFGIHLATFVQWHVAPEGSISIESKANDVARRTYRLPFEGAVHFEAVVSEAPGKGSFG